MCMHLITVLFSHHVCFIIIEYNKDSAVTCYSYEILLKGQKRVIHEGGAWFLNFPLTATYVELGCLFVVFPSRSRAINLVSPLWISSRK